MLKTSQLELNKRDMMSYIVNNMYYKITNQGGPEWKNLKLNLWSVIAIVR